MGNAPVFQESFTTAALDGARIAVATADLLVSMDRTIPEIQRIQVRDFLDEARQRLDEARMALPATESTSVHVVKAGGLIIPV